MIYRLVSSSEHEHSVYKSKDNLDIITTMDGTRTYKSEKGQDRAVHGHNHLVVSATFTTVDAELQLPDIDDYVPRNTSWHVVTLTDPPLFHGRYCLTTCQIS